jgi:hypothetical protein
MEEPHIVPEEVGVSIHSACAFQATLNVYVASKNLLSSKN